MDIVKIYDKQELENINKVLRKDKNNKYFTQQELEIANEINQRKEDKCMNNNIMIFKNNNFGEIRSLEIDGEPYFVGNEIAKILGYKNGSRDINRHVDEEDRKVVPIRYSLWNTKYNSDKRKRSIQLNNVK